MNLQPYTGHKAPGRLRCDDSTPLGKLDYRLRLVGDDLMIDAADMLQVIAKERDAADRRVKELESALIVMTADRDRLGSKVRAMVAATEPQVWAENSRNRNRILEIAMTDTAEPVRQS